MRIATFLIALLVSTASWAQAASTPFVADGVYSVRFGEGTPTVTRDTLPGRSGAAERATYVVETASAMQMLGTLAPPGGVDPEDGEAYFDSMIASLKGGMPGMQIVVNRPAASGAYRGREVEAANAEVTVMARMFVTRRGLVFAQAVFPRKSAPGRASAQAFVQSLAIMPGE